MRQVSVKKRLRPYLLLLLIACTIYWPLTFGIFSLKNDAIIYFLPRRYFISECIQNGYFPFWHPYLFTGLPLHAEMPSGTWNPVVLIFSLFTRYNMQTLEWELLLYIFIAGTGMYKLIKEIAKLPTTAFVCAVAYMCCGFILDSGSFIYWINCAAYLPFVFLYFYRGCKAPAFLTSLKFGLFLFLLFATCDPTFLIYACYIMLFGFTWWWIAMKPDKKIVIKAIQYFSLGLLFFLLLSAPAIISFAEFLSYYQRGSGASLQQALTDPFPPFSIISYFLPTAVAKSHPWLNTDLAMRNAYVGLFILLFFLMAVFKKKTLWYRFIMGATIFSLIFSMGAYTPLREWCYNIFPLLDTSRHPALIRSFTSIGIIIMAAPAINSFYLDKKDDRNIKKILLSFILLLAFIIIYYWPKSSFIERLPIVDNNFKQVLDKLTFADIAASQAVMQLIFVILFFIFIKRRRFIMFLVMVNCIFFAFTAFPFTFFSQIRTKVMNQYLSSFPKGYPRPDLKTPIEANSYSPGTTDSEYGYSKFYEKKITIQDNLTSSTIPDAYLNFLNDSSLRKQFDQFPFAFVTSVRKQNDTSAFLSVTAFSPGEFGFNLKNKTPAYLILFQQYNHNWKATVNNKPVKVEKAILAFMKVPIPAGNNIIKFKYRPQNIIYISMFLSLGLLLLILLYIIQVKRKSMLHHHQ